MKTIITLITCSLLLFPISTSAKKSKLMYTTYFYTANEAVVHGYESKTNVRIVSLTNKGTVWQGTIGRGKTKLIPTGKGVFAFLADKKATILVGTPSRCAVVGYYARDENGSYRSDHFFAQLPSSTSDQSAKVIVWAWEDTKIRLVNQSQDKVIIEKKLKKNEWYEIPNTQLASMGNNVLEATADKKAISMQIYFDQGFFVPANNGSGSGKYFRTFVGSITGGNNDLQLFAYNNDAKVTIKDIKKNTHIYDGVIKAGSVLTKRLTNVYVEITSNKLINVSVSPDQNYRGYAEHHYSPGLEGSGIDRDFILTTPGELWIFSYFTDNNVTVTDLNNSKEIFSKKLTKGTAAAVNPGAGFYRVKSQKSISVMGGANVCGAEFSPAGGMFSVDEALFAVIQQIKEQRIQRAKASGKTLTAKEMAAPLSKAEIQKVKKSMKKRSAERRVNADAAAGPAASKAAPAPAMQDDELEERIMEIQSR